MIVSPPMMLSVGSLTVAYSFENRCKIAIFIRVLSFDFANFSAFKRCSDRPNLVELPAMNQAFVHFI